MTVTFNGLERHTNYQCQRIAGQQSRRTQYAASTPQPDQLVGTQNAQICTVSGREGLETVVGEVPVDALGERHGRGGKISSDRPRGLCGMRVRAAGFG